MVAEWENRLSSHLSTRLPMPEKKRPVAPADEPSLPDKVISVHEALRVAKIPHAIGGALALAYYAEPRATIDIDLNIFVPTERWEEVVDALLPLGIDADKLDTAALLRDGQCRLWWGENAVDLFFSYDRIHDEMRKGARRLPFADETLPFLSPEHLAVCKAMFDRPKDWLDIEQMLIANDDLDIADIEQWLERMVGPQDQRLKRLSELMTR
jgi:hypothetical protein